MVKDRSTENFSANQFVILVKMALLISVGQNDAGQISFGQTCQSLI